MAAFPNIDPSVMKMIQSLGGGGGSAMPFLAGMGMSEFTANIKKLSDLAGGAKTGANVTQGQTGKPVTPIATAQRPPTPTTPAAPSMNPLLPLGQVIGPLAQGAASGGAAAFNAARPAAGLAGPAASAGTTAANVASGAGSGAYNALLSLLGLV